MELLEGIESSGWTIIKFQRQIASCEPEYDLAITVIKKNGCIFLIYFYTVLHLVTRFAKKILTNGATFARILNLVKLKKKAIMKILFA